MEPRRIIIFDGVCRFCNRAVNFIIKHDHDKVFHFSPMQSDAAQSLIAQYDLIHISADTLLLIKDGKSYVRAEAAFEISRDLSGGWKYLGVLRVLPAALTDWFYRKCATNRYNLFGKLSDCVIPSEELKSRFLE